MVLAIYGPALFISSVVSKMKIFLPFLLEVTIEIEPIKV